MQAIQTRFIGPSNVRGSRIKAYSEGFPRGVITGYDHALSVEENHDAALKAFVDRREWWGVWARGAAPDKRGNVYVCISRARDIRTPPPYATNPLDYVCIYKPEGK